MIDTDKRGQEKLQELMKSLDDFEWNEYESGFLDSMKARTYAALSPKQQAQVGRMHDKLMGR